MWLNHYSPGSIAQFKRIGDAVRGKADKKYGQTFNLSDELRFNWIKSN